MCGRGADKRRQSAAGQEVTTKVVSSGCVGPVGGHVEGEESAEDALRREASEELQVEIESFRLLDTVHDPVEPADIMVFAISAWKGEPINAAPDEHSRIGWFPVGELPGAAALDVYGELIVQATVMNSDDYSC